MFYDVQIINEKSHINGKGRMDNGSLWDLWKGAQTLLNTHDRKIMLEYNFTL